MKLRYRSVLSDYTRVTGSLAFLFVIFVLVVNLSGCISKPFYCDNPMTLGQSIVCLTWKSRKTGTSQDDPISIAELEELKQQASSGNVESQYEAGRYLFNVNKEESWYWMCGAAMKGHEEARIWTGLFYEYGLDPVEPDSVAALMWYRLSGKAGISHRKKLENEVDGERAAKASQMALEWVPGSCSGNNTGLN